MENYRFISLLFLNPNEQIVKIGLTTKKDVRPFVKLQTAIYGDPIGIVYSKNIRSLKKTEMIIKENFMVSHFSVCENNSDVIIKKNITCYTGFQFQLEELVSLLETLFF